MAGLPGVKVGPLDPDATSQFGQVAATHSARRLIKLHAQAHPPELVRAAALALDDERTKGLDMDEVADYVAGLKLENGDPVLRDGCTVVGASVRGKPDKPQILSFTYETESGRTAKWFAPYDEKALPDSYAEGTEITKLKAMRDRGVVSFDSEAARVDSLQREAAELRRQNRALRAHVEGDDVPEEPEGDTEPAKSRDNERLVRENQEMRERLAALEQLVQSQAASNVNAAAAPLPQGSLTGEEPVEGYDDMNVDAAESAIESASDAERELILAYERVNKNRRSVVAHAEKHLAKG